jgi:hypothetical protein
MLKIKEGASLNGLNVAMRPALLEWEKICSAYGVECVVTAGTDGEHSAGSMHYYGYAVDLRTRDMTDIQKQTARTNMAAKLGLAFDVVLHKTHLHVEYKIGGF